MQNAKKHTDKNISISKNEFDELVSERDEFKRQTEELKRQLDDLKRMIFGAKSERYVPVDSNQLKMFEDMIAEKEKEIEIEKHTIVYQREKAKKEKEKPVRSVIPAHFPRVREVIEPENIDPKAVKIVEEITELLEIKPMTIFVREIVRPKYALPKEQGIVIADLPSLPIPKGNASSSLLAFILISKFVDHLPLYRLLQIFKRQELIISKSTIGGWVSKTSELLQPLYDTFNLNYS